VTAPDCTPVSWLRLERYALGELGSGEHAEIAAHLATCARCSACADRIAADAQRALPPLPAVVARTPAPLPATPWRERLRRAWPGWWYALGAAAAAFALIFALRPGEPPHGPGARVVAVKGGEVAVELVRERGGSIAWEPTSFAAGDRLELLVTCAPPLRVHADVVVMQSDGPAFPGSPTLIPCGNRVPVPPAFQITGPGPATVCVLLDASAPTSRDLPSGRSIPLSTAHACIELDRAD
jgi:hypothetical protein